MSLQVWLPLNGSVNNQGLGNISSISGTPSFKSPGKIGTNGLNLKTRITFVCPQLANLQNFSIAFWAMVQTSSTLTSSWQDVMGFTDISSGGSSGTFRWETTYSSSNLGIHWHDNTTNALVNGSHNHNTVKEQWVHCCVVFNANTGKIYSYDNGILTQTHTHLNGHFNGTGTFYLGETNNIEGIINDVRIYDHCLSDKEVEEISKGLILHYKLDDMYSEPTINLCNGSTCGSQASAASPSTWGAHKYYTILTNTTSEDPVPFTQKSVMTIDYSTSYGSNGGASVYPPAGFTIEPSTTYVYSKYIKPSDNFDYVHANFLYRYEYASGGGTRLVEGGVFSKTNIEYVGNGWYRCWGVFTSQSTAVSVTLPFYTYPGKSMTYELGGIQLEKKSTMTPYVATTRIGMIYDSSGYQHNGTILNNITITPDSGRYNISTVFDGAAVISTTSPGADICTLSCWVKTSKNKSTSQMMVADSGSNMCISFYSGTIIGVFGTTRSTGSKSTLGAEYKENDWNHIVVLKTGNSGEREIYCNGVKLTAAANDYWSSSAGFFMGNRNASGSGNTPFYGQLADVRAYVTVLTEAQIKELYNTSASIDKDGNIYAREVIEE